MNQLTALRHTALRHLAEHVLPAFMEEQSGKEGQLETQLGVMLCLALDHSVVVPASPQRCLGRPSISYHLSVSLSIILPLYGVVHWGCKQGCHGQASGLDATDHSPCKRVEAGPYWRQYYYYNWIGGTHGFDYGYTTPLFAATCSDRPH